MASTASVTQLINDFRNKTSTGAFKHIGNRATIAVQLQDRINQPHKINQGYSSLCGPASFLYCLIKKSPKVYAKYIIDLFDTGIATLGALAVKPGSDTKNYSLPSSSGLTGIDWIGLASLRDSENDLLDYQNYNNQSAGITMPGDLLSWFTKSGFTDGINDTNVVVDKNLSTLLAAHQKQQSGHAVCLFIGANVLKGNNSGKAFPDHWVVLNSSIQIDNRPVLSLMAKGKSIDNDNSILQKRLAFSVYTWGDNSRAANLRKHDLTVDFFLDYFYGYISSK